MFLERIKEFMIVILQGYALIVKLMEANHEYKISPENYLDL